MQVTKILEGGIDLTTGKQLGTSIVISNGIREISVPISDGETLDQLIVMVSESNQTTPTDAEELSRTIGPPPEPAPRERIPAQAPRLVEPDPDPPVLQSDEDGFEPGEEYDDLGTGASSV